MKQHNESKKVQLFSKYGQNSTVMYGCHGYQKETLWDDPVIVYCSDSLFFFNS